MKRTIIESPFSGELDRNRTYLLRCWEDSLFHGESPIASHALTPQVIPDGETFARKFGLRTGYAWMRVADQVVFYEDYGWSEGMLAARAEARTLDISVVLRTIGENP